MKVARTIGELCMQYVNLDDFCFKLDILIDATLVILVGQRLYLLELDNLNLGKVR